MARSLRMRRGIPSYDSRICKSERDYARLATRILMDFNNFDDDDATGFLRDSFDARIVILSRARLNDS